MVLSPEDWPSALATFFGINETTAGLILSVAVIVSLLFPTMYLAHGENAVTIWLIVTFIGECIVLGLGWLDIWIMIMTISVTVLAMAFVSSKAIGG